MELIDKTNTLRERQSNKITKKLNSVTRMENTKNISNVQLKT